MVTIKLLLLLSCLLCVAIAELEYVNEEAENENEGITGSGSGSGSGMEGWDDQEEKGRDENEESEGNDRKKRTNEEENVNETRSESSSNSTSSSNSKGETPEKKTELNGQKPKGLTSNTEVSVPAGVIAKVFGGSNNGTASLVSTPNQSTASVSPSEDDVHAKDETFSEKRDNLKPKPIGPMETLEVTINGQASTKNNFTKTAPLDSEEIELPQMQKIEGKNVVRKSISKEKHLKKPKISHKKNNKSKRNKVAFPKIILYQGPLSKAIEKMLYSKTTTEKKRSEIEKLFRGEKAEKKRIVQENSNDNDESEEPKEHPNDSKKSNVNVSKKYKVKGFVDDIEIDSTLKKSKTDDMKEKASVIQSDEIMREHLNNMMRDSSPYSRSYVAKKSKTVQSNEDKNEKKPERFTSSNRPPMIHLKDSQKNKDEASGDDDEELEVKNNKSDESSGEEEKKKTEEEDNDDEEGSSEEDGDDDEGSANIGMQTHNPDEPKPEPVKEEEPTNPEIKPSNAPDGPSVGNLPPAIQNKPIPVDTPLPLQPKLPQLPQSQQPLPQLSPPNPLPISIPFPPINLPPPPQPPQRPATEVNSDASQDDQSYFQDDLMTQVDLNTQGIEALSSRVSELENKEKELENAMGSISEGLERIEKKLDTQQHKQSITSFSEFNPVNPQQEQPNIANGENPKKPAVMIDVLKKIYDMFSMKPQLGLNGFKQVRRRPKVIKEIFIPLPAKGSIQAQAIENGKLMDSPILNRLPLPIRQIVNNIFKHQLRKEEPTEESDEPAKEHDLDKLELQLGRIPISRHGVFQRMPKLLVFAKAPRFQELMARPCYKPCQNGGHCLGNNVCRCYHGFAGPQCQHRLRPTIVEIIGPSPIQLFKQNRNSHQITLPIAPVVESSVSDEDDDDDGKQKTVGHVDQSQIVNVLRNTLPFKTFTEEGENYDDAPFKRYRIPHRYQPGDYQRYNDYHQNVYHRYY